MRYGTLFQVEIQHDYFLGLGSVVHEALGDDQQRAARQAYSVASFLQAFPTTDTLRVLAGHRCIFRPTASGFLVGIQLDPSSVSERPALSPGAGFRLRIALVLRDPFFLNYTALAEGAPGFYFFSNGSGNEVGGQRFLSRAVPAFDAARAYEAGEVRAQVSGGTINLFRAERDTGPSASPVAADWQRIPPDTFDTAVTYRAGAVVLSANRLFRALVDGPDDDLNDAADWQPLGSLANQYVTAADSRALRPTRLVVDLSGEALPQATLRLLAPGVTAPVWERVYDAPAGNLRSVAVDLSAVEPGPYRLVVLDGSLAEVPGRALDLVLDPEAAREGWIGLIEIGSAGGGMALFDGAGVLRSPRYTIRFLNRATRWRYIFPVAQAVAAGADVAVESADPRILVTAASRPLTRFGVGVRLQADVSATPSISEEVRLPEPGVKTVLRQDHQWFSEIHTINLSV